LALQDQCPTLPAAADALSNDRIPIALAFSAAEKAKAKYVGALRREFNVNKFGWKLGHLRRIGLKRRGELPTFPINELEDHFRNLMDPANMFVVPMAWSGLAEISEMTEAIRKYGHGRGDE
jgi:hypothetical protein